MPNAFQLGLDPEIAKMLGSEEDDKKSFFANVANGHTMSTESSMSISGVLTSSSSSAVHNLSTIPRSSQSSWDRVGNNANTITTPQSSSAEILAAIKKEEEAAEQRQREREERKKREAEERERSREELRQRQALKRQQQQQEQLEELTASVMNKDVDNEQEAGNEVLQQPANSRYHEGVNNMTATTLSTNTLPSLSADSTEATPAKPPPAPAPCKECPALKTQLDVLTRQLNSEREQQQQTLDTHISHLKAAHEAEMLTKDQQIEILESRVTQLETENILHATKAAGKDVRADIKKGIIEMVTVEEMKKIKQEIDEQEALIAASQAQDIKNTSEIKQLRKQIADLQQELVKHQKKTVPQASGPEMASGNLTTENFKLREEIRLLGEEYQLKVNTLNKKVKELEGKLAKVDWDKTDTDTMKIRELMLKIEQQDQIHAETVEELTEKLNWYIRNQDLLGERDNVLERQAVEIETLKSRLAEADGPIKRPKKQVDQRKYIAELQKKVKSLEEIIKNKYPNSIPELIRACKPTETEVAMYQTMQDRIEMLNNELASREEEYEKGIRQLRQETDKAILEHKQRYQQLQDEMKAKVRTATSTKVKELERRVEDTRGYYTKKVKELEATILDLRKAGKRSTATTGKQQTSTVSKGRHPTATTGTQTHAVELGPVGQPVGAQHTVIHQPHYIPAAGQTMQDLVYITTEVGKLNAEIAKLRTEGEFKDREVASLQEKVKELKEEIAKGDREKKAWEAEVRACDERARMAARDAGAEREQLMAMHEKELSAMRMKYQEQIDSMQRATVETPPQDASPAARLQYIDLIKRKLAQMEREYAMRKTEHERELQETKRLAAYEVSVQKQKMNLVIQMKNQEIERFRINLDSLLEELSMLKAARGSGSTTA